LNIKATVRSARQKVLTASVQQMSLSLREWIWSRKRFISLNNPWY